MSRSRLAALAAFALLCCAVSAGAGARSEAGPPAGTASWPGWRGPGGTGIAAEETVNPKSLSDAMTPRWVARVGEGFSTVAVGGGRVYTIGGGRSDETVYCLNERDGTVVWKHTYDITKTQYPGPRSTPSLEDGFLYTVGAAGRVICFRADSGAVVWQVDLAADHGYPRPEWDFSTSPVIHGETIYLNAGSSGIAFDKRTGRPRWASPPGVAGYASPVILETSGREQLLVFGARALLGVDLSDGTVLWSYEWVTPYDVNAADPLVVGDRVFISSNYRRGCALIEIGADGPRLVWENYAFSSHFSSFIHVDGFIYGNDGDANARRGFFRCVDAETGDVRWSSSAAGVGSLLAVKNGLLLLTERRRLVLVELSPDGYVELGAATLERGLFWSPPTVCGGTLYVRSMTGELYAYDVR